jgi:ethanolamine ammonia-lyase small subunit
MEGPDKAAESPTPTGNGRDPWSFLSSHTGARIAMGRAGGSLRTPSLLDFRLSHSRAVDAVNAPFDVAALEEAFGAVGLWTERLATRVSDRRTYLLRPDLGRVLDPRSAESLRSKSASWGRRDLAVLVSDGLCADAARSHAALTVSELARIMTGSGWALYPVFIAPFSRVKLQDEVGGILGARHSVILLGERPGLSAPDSLGAYLTFEPRPDRTDADRNCVSNIRGGGLRPAEAAKRIAHLLIESRRLGLSGTGLRDVPGNPGPTQIRDDALP